MTIGRTSADDRADARRAAGRVEGPLPADLAFEIRSLCHDLNQPVAAARMLLGALVHEPLPVEAAGHVRALGEELESIAAIITGEPGRVRRRLELVELIPLVSSCARTAERFRGVRVDVTTSGSPRVVGVASDLRRAVGNVVDNACRATGSGVVSVSVSGTRGWCEVVVTDDGPGFGGIAAGSGIGLRQVRAAITQHQGHLEIDAAEQGGTVVRLSFPSARTLAS